MHSARWDEQMRGLPGTAGPKPGTAGPKPLHKGLPAESNVNKEKLAYILATAHDLKTPIQSILYALDLLSTDDSTSLSDEQNKLVRQARSAAEIMTSVVCQALDVGKAQSGHDLIPRRSKVSLNAIVDHVQMLVEGVPKSVPVSYNISKGVPEILFTDEEWVRQMLLKLITNACKHTFSGEITVEVKIGHASGTLLFEVTDTGVGVSEDDKTIFEPFQPKKEGECGTGVGLYVLRKRVESLSGTFGVRENTDAGMGSIFWFAVPYEGASIFTDAQRVRMASREREAAPASAAAQGVSQAPRTWTDEVNKVVDKTTSIMLPSRERQLPSSMNSLAQKAASGREKDEEVSCGKTKRKSSSGGSESDLDVDRVRAYRLKAIIVEDTPSVSKLLQKMMLSLGYESVECYANGALGLEAMKQKQVDVVITDVNMPIMNGDKMVSAFREYEQQMLQSGERTSSQMIVACSANCNAILEAKLIQVGCDGVYAKPLARRHVLELTKEFAIEQLGNRAETC